MKNLFLFSILIFGIIQAYSSPRIVKVGAFNYYPGIFKDKDDSIKGFFVDALRSIEIENDLKFEFVYGSWAEGLQRLKANEIDMVTSIAFTNERAQFFDFCEPPLITVWGEVYVRPNSDINGLLDLKDKTIGVMKSDINGAHLRDLVEKLSISCTFIETEDFESVFKLISDEKVDAGVVNNTFGAPKGPEYGLRSSGIIFNPFKIYFAVGKNRNKELRLLLDDYLQKWQYDRNSVFNKARQKWSHGMVGEVKFIPLVVRNSIILSIILIVILVLFIFILRYKVEKATAEVRKKDMVFKIFMENNPAYVYIKDRKLKHTYSNKQVEKIMAKASKNSEIDGQNLFDEETLKRIKEADTQILSGERKSIDLQYTITIGENEIWLHDYKFPLDLPDEQKAVGGIAFDITQLKEVQRDLTQANSIIEKSISVLKSKNDEYEAMNEILRQTNEELSLSKEKAEESDRLKTAFLQNISHEVRTPLNAIIGFSGLLANDFSNLEKSEGYVSIIQSSSYQLLSIISDVLTISSLESNQEKVFIETFDFRLLCEELVDVFNLLAKDKKLDFRYVKLEEALWLSTDRMKLFQVLRNILGNAFKFTERGFVEFDVIVSPAINSVDFIIKDTGIGIDPGKEQIIFEPFRQAETELSKQYGGTGLGLSIAKSYVELLDGSISLESVVNKGTSFKVTLPGLLTEKKEASEPKNEQIKESIILIADDEENNYFLLHEFLSMPHLKIRYANNGRKAVEIASSEKLDLILMDIKMPVMDGYQAAILIKQKYPHLPIVAQTAYGLDFEMDRYRDVFNDYLIKPIRRSELFEALSRWL